MIPAIIEKFVPNACAWLELRGLQPDSLEKQQTRSPALRNPLPEYAGRADFPVLPHWGDYSMLRSLSDDLGPGIGAQSKPPVLVLVAGSGAGKTHAITSLAAGSIDRQDDLPWLVVPVRFAMGGAKSPPVRLLLERAAALVQNRVHEAASSDEVVLLSQLFVAAHICWALALLHAADDTNTRRITRDAALAVVRNLLDLHDSGNEVAAVFNELLRQIPLGFAVGEFLKGLWTEMRSWSKSVVVLYDEIFSLRGQVSGASAPSAQLTDMFYAMCLAASELRGVFDRGFGQAMADTHTSISDLLQLPEQSPLRAQWRTFTAYTSVNAQFVDRVVRHYFHLSFESTGDVLKTMDKFSGRPLWLFEHLIDQLRSFDVREAAFSEDAFNRAARMAFDNARVHVLMILRKYWTDPRSIALVVDAVCAELVFDGEVSSSGMLTELADSSILARSQHTRASLHDEPVVSAAVIEFALENLHGLLVRDMQKRVEAGRFLENPGIRGFTMEFAFAMELVQRCAHSTVAGTPPTVSSLLRGARLVGLPADVHALITADSNGLLHAKYLNQAVQDMRYRVLYWGVKDLWGPDLLLILPRPETGGVVAFAFQVKTGESVTAADALASLDPSRAMQRMRAALPADARVDLWVRVPVLPVSWQAPTKPWELKLRETDGTSSPIVVIPIPDWAHERLRTRVRKIRPPQATTWNKLQDNVRRWKP